MKNRTTKFVVYLLLFMGGLGSVALITMGDYALSWDEPTRWNLRNLKLDYYERLIASDDKLKILNEASDDVYPGLVHIPLALARRVFPEPDIFLSRIWNVSFGLLAVLCAVMISRMVLEGGEDLIRSSIATASALFGWSYAALRFLSFTAISLSTLRMCLLRRCIPWHYWPCCVWFVSFRMLAEKVIVCSRWLLDWLWRLGLRVCVVYFGLAATVWCFFVEKGDSWRKRIQGLWGYAWRGVIVGLIAFTILIPWWSRYS